MLPSPFASVFTNTPVAVIFALPSELPSTTTPAPVGSTDKSLLPSPFASILARTPFAVMLLAPSSFASTFTTPPVTVKLAVPDELPSTT